jgi:cell filamentation protein
VKALEHASFQINLDKAIKTLAAIEFIEYKHVLEVHKTLFGDVYPWAGQDRSTTAPGINITKSGYNSLFAQSPYVRRVTEYAINQGQALNIMREQPGYILGSLAHAHPFLDGNGRTILLIHTELAYRAGINVDWAKTEKMAYLTVLTMELIDPDKGHLDNYLNPFIGKAVNRQQSASVIRSLKGLGFKGTDEASTPS